MRENILGWGCPFLLFLYRRDIAWAVGCAEREVPLLDRQRAINALLKAGELYRSHYTTIARILQGPLFGGGVGRS